MCTEIFRMPFSLNSNDVKGKALDVQLYISQCAVLAHNLLYAAEPKPGGASFNYELADTKTMDFLAGGSSLFAPIFGLSKRGILVAENHMWFEDAELGLYILKALERAITWSKSETNTIFGTILMFSPITLGIAHCFTNEGLKTNVRLNLDNVMNITDQFLKNSTTDDCTYLTKALTKFVSDRILPSDKVDDDFNSFLEIHQHERTNLYEFTKFYEDRDVIFHELSHKYHSTIKYGYSTFVKVYEETSNFKKSIIQTYATLLAEKKDTHIAKRFGNEVATNINKKAKSIIKQGGIFTVQGKQKISELDSYLRTSHSRVINPGSTADLTATTIFLALLQGYRP
ncbi:MAG: triphosphoribosyl-dephospho-CoA synthase [Candidatus Heimdallarchaeaceae archaeon]